MRMRNIVVESAFDVCPFLTILSPVASMQLMHVLVSQYSVIRYVLLCRLARLGDFKVLIFVTAWSYGVRGSVVLTGLCVVAASESTNDVVWRRSIKPREPMLDLVAQNWSILLHRTTRLANNRGRGLEKKEAAGAARQTRFRTSPFPRVRLSTRSPLHHATRPNAFVSALRVLDLEIRSWTGCRSALAGGLKLLSVSPGCPPLVSSGCLGGSSRPGLFQSTCIFGLSKMR